VPTSSMKTQSRIWIAGAVVGPISLIFLVGLLVMFVFKRRKNNGIPEEKENFVDKAQLHADSIARPQYEMEGEGALEAIPELPAKEPVGSELPESPRLEELC